MDLKREMVSQMSEKEFLTFFFPRAAFRACMLIFSSAIPDGCAFTRIHSWELLGTTTASDCRLLSSSSPAAGGVKGISTVAVERQIGILVIQTSLRGRASLEAEKKCPCLCQTSTTEASLFVQQLSTEGQ